MASKYGKYITTELKRNVVMPGYKGKQIIRQGYADGFRLPLEHILWMDTEVLPGAFYGEYTWQWPLTMKDQNPNFMRPNAELVTPELVKNGKVRNIMPHAHPFVEIFSYFGTNFDDPSDLGGEIEFWLENEKLVLKKSFIVYIPANMEHCPLVFRRMDRPMFHMTLGPGDKYV
jgi:hypothetical protein